MSISLDERPPASDVALSRDVHPASRWSRTGRFGGRRPGPQLGLVLLGLAALALTVGIVAVVGDDGSGGGLTPMPPVDEDRVVGLSGEPAVAADRLSGGDASARATGLGAVSTDDGTRSTTETADAEDPAPGTDGQATPPTSPTSPTGSSTVSPGDRTSMTPTEMTTTTKTQPTTGATKPESTIRDLTTAGGGTTVTQPSTTTRPASSVTRPSVTEPSVTDPTPEPTIVPAAGQVIWADDFDRLDTNRWAVEHSTYGDGNDELQCYRPENVSVSSGRLVLRAVSENYTCPNGSTRQVTSGMIRSRGVRFEPGHALEFRVKLTPSDEANQGGLWPAVWSSGWAGGGWPRGGEIDYLEVMTANDPTRSIYSIHYEEPGGSRGVDNQPVFGGSNFSTDWHTIRFEYGLNGELRWFLDGRQVHRVDSVQTAQGYPAPFDRAIGEIKINLALGGRPGPLDQRAIGDRGATFEVDYIRIVSL